MLVEVIMPKMGESIQEGTILRWLRKVGDKIQKDETILEISTDKVDSEIPSPISGTLVKITAEEQDTVPVGNIIAYIETEANVDLTKYEANINVQTVKTAEEEEIFITEKKHLHKKEKNNRERFYSPLVKKIIQQENIDKDELELLVGSGFNGRVTKNDVLRYVEFRKKKILGIGVNEKDFKIYRSDIRELINKYPEPKYKVVQMDNIQRKMAEHMMRSVRTSPHVTVVDEVDITEIMNFRFRILQMFEKQQGFKLTLTPFFAYAVVKSLKEYPILNCSVEGDAVIYKNFINLGIAVASPAGLIVPVVRNAEEMNFTNLAKSLADISNRAKEKKLTPDEITNGTFSITNYGVFGNIIGTPIINQPQVGILGVGAVKKRPVVLIDSESEEKIGIRSMVYLTLSFDHRIVDGATGGQFLARVKWYLENFNYKEIE